MEPKAGDRVEVHLAKSSYVGVLLESPESGIILVKLDTGYNVGLNKKDVIAIEVLSHRKEITNVVEIPASKDKPNIVMIITGGTIAARLNPKKGGVDWLDSPESLFQYYPGLFDKVNVSKVEVPFMKASEDMDFKDWQKLAKVCEPHLKDGNIKGIIITHGTDFLHYTSAALSFFLGEVNKPVVLTYSQRSIDRASSDADLNLQCAALACISDIAEVMIVGHASSNDDFCYAIAGTKVRKMHSSRRDAFKPMNRKPFAKIYPVAPLGVPQIAECGGIEVLSEYKIRNKHKVVIDTKVEEKVVLLKYYPGQDPNILDYYLEKGYKGLVLEMGALGHVATMRARNGWTRKLKEVQEKGLIVCATTQCLYGRTNPLVYSNGRELMETGIIYLEDMLSETAFVKLGWVLGHKDWSDSREKIKEKMLENFSWETNPRLEE